MRNLGAFQMRINAVIVEALQRPIARFLHLLGPGQARPDLGGQVFQIFHQLGMGYYLFINLLVSLFHGSFVGLLGFIGAIVRRGLCNQDRAKTG